MSSSRNIKPGPARGIKWQEPVELILTVFASNEKNSVEFIDFRESLLVYDFRKVTGWRRFSQTIECRRRFFRIIRLNLINIPEKALWGHVCQIGRNCND